VTPPARLAGGSVKKSSSTWAVVFYTKSELGRESKNTKGPKKKGAGSQTGDQGPPLRTNKSLLKKKNRGEEHGGANKETRPETSKGGPPRSIVRLEKGFGGRGDGVWCEFLGWKEA